MAEASRSGRFFVRLLTGQLWCKRQDHGVDRMNDAIRRGHIGDDDVRRTAESVGDGRIAAREEECSLKASDPVRRRYVAGISRSSSRY